MCGCPAVVVGVVGKIFRYPVKSLEGEELDEAFITFEGVEGDRRYGLLDLETGLIVSAKNPKLYPNILNVKAYIKNGLLTVQLPDGKTYIGDECEKPLSTYLGREVKLVKNEGRRLGFTGLEVDFSGGITFLEKQSQTREKTFHDSMPVHIVFVEELERLGLQKEVARFRPNILINSFKPKQEILNTTLEMGGALLRIVKKTKRCIVTTLPQQGLGQDITILKRIREKCNGVVGQYAEVVCEGVVRKGDPIKFYAAEKI